jgi:hypothetical protein
MAGISPEQLVRPFLPRPLGPALSGNIYTPPAPGVVQIRWEGKGGKTFQYQSSFSSSMEPPTTESYTEVKRVSEKKRVTNPQDDSQYVDTQRAKEVTLRNDDAATGSSGSRKGLKIKYKYPD